MDVVENFVKSIGVKKAVQSPRHGPGMYMCTKEQPQPLQAGKLQHALQSDAGWTFEGLCLCTCAGAGLRDNELVQRGEGGPMRHTGHRPDAN